MVMKGAVKLCEDSTPSLLHFQVRQYQGTIADVWRRKIGDEFVWECNALAKDKSWGCMMSNKDNREAQCSHTLACQMVMEEIKCKKS